MIKILVLCDSPTTSTGFARVGQNLMKRWHELGAWIDCWGIGFNGWNYRACPYVENIFPAALDGHWAQPERLSLFLAQLQQGGYTHVWIMQDTFMLSRAKFPETLKAVCDHHGIRSMYYFPVDAPLDREWTEMIAAADVAVAYTEYGRDQVIAANPAAREWPIQVLPHGVDTEIYRPLGDEATRQELRRGLWDKDWVQPGDFLMLNVNANQRRKDTTRSLEILRALIDLGVPAKLVMHMQETSGEQMSLVTVAARLGLEQEVHWTHHGEFFKRGHSSLKETELVKIYNAADLYLTTSLGEGWGLGITEALGCGCPVAMPEHTACAEIAGVMAAQGLSMQRVMLPLETHGVVLDSDNSRVRYRVNVRDAAQMIKSWRSIILPSVKRGPLSRHPGFEQWVNWDRIARKMWNLMTSVPKVTAARPQPAVPGGESQSKEGVQTPA